jgi:hypothetical protein
MKATRVSSDDLKMGTNPKRYLRGFKFCSTILPLLPTTTKWCITTVASLPALMQVEDRVIMANP